ncbi:hypothetical protein [Caldibacillus debilis]|uniref:Uncharacterized protein n=1 Tax=Caldibacillus debilis GB1 TaxID=1339248 RepID=A0A420VDW4_9BACI|nr:hypothetical protein [Caldibacillus debilis]RKO61710.1 hypothetical protein Cdeb_01181 [Caldibacillus debilis GB1]
MWLVGFQRFMKILLEMFAKLEWVDQEKRLVVERKPGGGGVTVVLEVGGETVYLEQFTWEVLYSVLVPNHKLDLLYLMQDVIREVEEGSHPAIVRNFMNRFMERLVPAFMKRWMDQQLLEEKPFKVNGQTYVQLALAL